MMKGGHGQTNQLHVCDNNWGAHDHAFCIPQLMSCDNERNCRYTRVTCTYTCTCGMLRTRKM